MLLDELAELVDGDDSLDVLNASVELELVLADDDELLLLVWLLDELLFVRLLELTDRDD